MYNHYTLSTFSYFFFNFKGVNIVGIDIPRGEDFLNTWFDIYTGVGEFNIYLLIVGLGTLVTAIVVKILKPKF